MQYNEGGGLYFSGLIEKKTTMGSARLRNKLETTMYTVLRKSTKNKIMVLPSFLQLFCGAVETGGKVNLGRFFIEDKYNTAYLQKAQ